MRSILLPAAKMSLQCTASTRGKESRLRLRLPAVHYRVHDAPGFAHLRPGIPPEAPQGEAAGSQRAAVAHPDRTRNAHEQHPMGDRGEGTHDAAALVVDDRQSLALEADVRHLVAQDLIADA